MLCKGSHPGNTTYTPIRHQNMCKFLCSLIICAFTIPVYAINDIVGNWENSNKKLRYDFIEGFAPNRGVVIEYKNGIPKEISNWTLEETTIQIGWPSKAYKVAGNVLTLDGEIFQRVPTQKTENVIELKNDPQGFIDDFVGHYWLNPVKEKMFLYKTAFSPTSGMYSVEEKKEQSKLGGWSFANEVIKIGDEMYLNGRITDSYLLLLNSKNEITFLQKDGVSPNFEKFELKEKRKKFIKSLVSGRWMRPGSGSTPDYQEYRPVFGDLRGVVFKYDDTKYDGSVNWKYLPETGSLKIGWTEYIKAQIQGPFLTLLEKDGKTKSWVRPNGEEIKEFTQSDVRQLKVAEADTSAIKELLERQWFNDPYTYNFSFKDNGKEGWLHEFRSFPFVISGNTFKIKGSSGFDSVRFVDGKVVFGENFVKSYSSDAKPVYLVPQSEEEAVKLADVQRQKTQDFAKSKMFLVVRMKDGVRHRVELPVGEMTNVISLSVEPGL